MKAELELVKRRFIDKENGTKKAEAERDALERNIAKYITENKVCQKTLESECSYTEKLRDMYNYLVIIILWVIKVLNFHNSLY